ncbi:Methylamine utilisation protein MauE [Chitinophaga sp. YR627]|uniref:MauE/DoxX family redox-associated membrane protein n=1 Tax=Chitinophaga sp. YR627 TaxID=1881041 RepID=UPI0008E0130E|nr:MauE/DoxX family redox-associated membrane protein [Chitinophaga sp. YR627]SFO92321.1 Methylamine utilisation protein MauE [Chitinophaga sp. YR627]
MLRRTVLETIRLLFILLFVYTAVSKFLDYENFRAVIGQSPLLTRFAPVLAIVVPVAEIVIALLLVLPRYRRTGLYASFAMMMLFTTYIIVLMTLAEKVPCSCGGVISRMTWTQHLYFNIFFVLLAFLGMWLYTRPDDNIRPSKQLVHA